MAFSSRLDCLVLEQQTSYDSGNAFIVWLRLCRAMSYQPAVGESFTVTGIVDRTSDQEMHANGIYVRLFVRLADFTVAPASADEVTIDSAVYTVFNVANDSGGGCWLSLREKI
jgi:hypothetical protein